jgi:hypothetical protein
VARTDAGAETRTPSGADGAKAGTDYGPSFAEPTGVTNAEQDARDAPDHVRDAVAGQAPDGMGGAQHQGLVDRTAERGSGTDEVEISASEVPGGVDAEPGDKAVVKVTVDEQGDAGRQGGEGALGVAFGAGPQETAAPVADVDLVEIKSDGDADNATDAADPDQAQADSDQGKAGTDQGQADSDQAQADDEGTGQRQHDSADILAPDGVSTGGDTGPEGDGDGAAEQGPGLVDMSEAAADPEVGDQLRRDVNDGVVEVHDDGSAYFRIDDPAAADPIREFLEARDFADAEYQDLTGKAEELGFKFHDESSGEPREASELVRGEFDEVMLAKMLSEVPESATDEQVDDLYTAGARYLTAERMAENAAPGAVDAMTGWLANRYGGDAAAVQSSTSDAPDAPGDLDDGGADAPVGVGGQTGDGVNINLTNVNDNSGGQSEGPDWREAAQFGYNLARGAMTMPAEMTRQYGFEAARGIMEAPEGTRPEQGDGRREAWPLRFIKGVGKFLGEVAALVPNVAVRGVGSVGRNFFEARNEVRQARYVDAGDRGADRGADGGADRGGERGRDREYRAEPEWNPTTGDPAIRMSDGTSPDAARDSGR